MQWFEGTIPEAIQQTKSKRSLFLVYIYGDDEQSTKLTESFNDSEVHSLCISSNTVALKLEVKSEGGVQFSQIYPVIIVPCIFFIGDNGVPLEVAGGYLPPSELAQKFQKALQLHSPSVAQPDASSAQQVSTPAPASAGTATPPQPVDTPTSPPQNVPQPTASVETAATTSATVSAAAEQPLDDGSTSSAAPESSSSTESLEEKKEKALKLLAKKREEKAKAEEEKEKLQEVERRKLGHEMAKLKQFKEERERKEIENSYKKQKEEDRLARERVRAELERDRQERALKFKQEKVDEEIAAMRAKREKLAMRAEEEAKQTAAKREHARIQFRLPDGSSVTNTFSSSDLLTNCRSFILEHLGGRYQSVSLSTIYPKRTFTEADMAQSLLDLELVPSAALVVLPQTSQNTTSGGVGSDGGIVSLFWWLLAPLLALWSFICTFLFASPTPSPSGPTHTTDPVQPQAPYRNDDPSTSARQRTAKPDGLKRHQDGNIRRFTSDDDEDENATWNGNSTQQM